MRCKCPIGSYRVKVSQEGTVVKAVNLTKSTVVAINLKEASGFILRLKGLIGRTRLDEGEGLWMARCRAIHTIGMRFPIDVVFLDRDFVVKKVVKGVPPFRPIVRCLSAAGVIEIPAGTIERAQIQVGDNIKITCVSK